jgi:fluoroacetyl-CoA thioesterase
MACTLTYQVRPRDLVNTLFPGASEFARKPAVLATGILVALCEWPAMDALRQVIDDDEDSLGTEVHLTHRAPVGAGTKLTVTARCISITGQVSRWDVCAQDGARVVARGWVQFAVVRTETFIQRHMLKPTSRPALPSMKHQPDKQYIQDDRDRLVACGTSMACPMIRI